jgi:hypothetical protein
MTQKEIKKAQLRLDDLYESMRGSSVEDIIHEIVELELQLEAGCGK